MQKWTETVNINQNLTKCGTLLKSMLTVSSKRCSSEYGVFSERQSHFTSGDIQSGGLKIEVTQQAIKKCIT